MKVRLLGTLLFLGIGGGTAPAANPAPSLPAAELASRMAALRRTPGTYVRLRMEIKPAAGAATVLQLQIKERRTESSAELVYQILWPKERKGESVLLQKSGGALSGTVRTAAGEVHALDAGQMKQPLFGSDLTYEDVLDDFFTWERQSSPGTEAVGHTTCQILESKPGAKDHSTYSLARSWIDLERMVPLRVEKFDGAGHPVRAIETSKITKDGDHYIPADLIVRGPRRDSETILDGSRIKHDVHYTDRDFTPEAIKELSVPRGGDE